MRRINAPGIEVNEIDKSHYSQITDESLTDTAVLVMGFADKGFDYKTNFVNNINMFSQLYGNPTTEAERYFYYAAKEVLDSRGVLYCAKLPYYNESKDKYSYTTYKVDTALHLLSTPYEVMTERLPVVDLEDSNVNLVEDPQKLNNSFYDVLTFRDLPFEYLEIVDDYLSNTTSSLKYNLIEDLVQFSYSQTNIDISYKELLFDAFDGIFGIYRLKRLLAEDGLEWLDEQYKKSMSLTGEPELEIPVSDEKQGFEELRQTFLKYYENGIESLLEEFGKTRKVSEFKKYYQSLRTFMEPLLSNNQFTLSGELDPSHKNRFGRLFKENYNNLQYFTDLNFYNQHKAQLSSEYTEENWNKFGYRHGDLKAIDETLTSYVKIESIPSSSRSSGIIDIDDLDRLKTNQKRPQLNTFQIVDLGKTQYKKTSDQDLECIGLLPVITTAANAMYFKQLDKDEDTTAAFNVIQKIQTVFNRKVTNDLTAEMYYDKDMKSYLFDQNLSCQTDKSSYSDVALSYFPELQYTATQRIDKNYLKQIGVVVFMMKRATESSSKIQLYSLESFVGSLDRESTDNKTGTKNFIDDIINTNSEYINFFSNVEFVKNSTLDSSSLMMIQNQTATSLGFYEYQCEKLINVEQSIIKPMEKILDTNKNIDEIDIDLVLDAGMSTIAQFIEYTTQNENGSGYYDLTDIQQKNFSISTSAISSKLDVRAWRKIASMYDNFCKNTRKDCMFLLDAIRSTCLETNHKIVRSTNLKNTIDSQIIPRLRPQLNLNTSYGAGYCNWVYVYDPHSTLYFWLPPSIKTAGKIIQNDIYFNYWDAPAGFNRGILDGVVDIAFNPTIEEAGRIYNMSWNYIVSYPVEGSVIEGQKTFQLEKTAFDRVNVRRLFLKLEKAVYKISKRFVYEGNTEYTRQRFVDTIRPLFEEAKNGGGLSEYIIICNEKNNTTQTIENNELHCTIAVRPIKSIEFIVLNFIALPQSGTFSEEQLLQIANNRYTES